VHRIDAKLITRYEEHPHVPSNMFANTRLVLLQLPLWRRGGEDLICLWNDMCINDIYVYAHNQTHGQLYYSQSRGDHTPLCFVTTCNNGVYNGEDIYAPLNIFLALFVDIKLL
jgi:hypothetical protein